MADYKSLLQRAQQKTEELFISGDDGIVLEIRKESGPEGEKE